MFIINFFPFFLLSLFIFSANAQVPSNPAETDINGAWTFEKGINEQTEKKTVQVIQTGDEIESITKDPNDSTKIESYSFKGSLTGSTFTGSVYLKATTRSCSMLDGFFPASGIVSSDGNTLTLSWDAGLYEVEGCALTGDRDPQSKTYTRKQSQPASPSPVPPAENAPQRPEETAKDPVIDSLTPETVAAGEGELDELTGLVKFSVNYVKFEIHGQNLDGAEFSADNQGLDNQPGVDFTSIEVLNKGTYVRGYIMSFPTAKDGQTNVTLTNKYGRTATRPINVTITGTQYLKRTFQDSIWFLGDWKDVVPNQHITDLENNIKSGLNKIEPSSYKNLEILPVVYEEGFWKKSDCGSNWADLTGCAVPSNRMIKLRDSDEITPTIFHEAVHKLDYYHRGEYRGIPGVPTTADSFFSTWKTAARRAAGQPLCPYLPLRGTSEWNDGTSDVPHCGMIVAYGASDPPDPYAISDIHGYYEDVATMAESYIFAPGLFRIPDATTDSRYDKKVNLLKQYGFLP